MRFALAFLLLCSSAFGQITGPSTVKQGERVVLKVELPEGARVAWLAESGADVVKFNGNWAYAWGTAGRTNNYQAVVVPADENAEPVVWKHTVTIDGKPVPPGPVTTLKQLAGDKAQALGTLYAGLAKQVQNSSTAAKFRAAHDSLLKLQGLTGHGATAEIDKRLAVVLVDPLDHARLRTTLEAFVAELGNLPPPEPDPDPDPSPAPIPVAGLHVLIVEETDDRLNVPAGQLAVLQTTQIGEAVRAAGGQFRQYDDDPDIADPTWKAARARPRTAIPWIIVSNAEKGGAEVPLPASIEETLALIRRFQ